MMNVRERLAKFQAGVGVLSQEMPDSIKALLGFFESATKDGALTFREKELVAIGISMYHRCEDCIIVHTYKALQAGCTRKEILEAAAVSMVFGGGPTLGASATLLLDALSEFEKDFQK